MDRRSIIHGAGRAVKRSAHASRGVQGLELAASFAPDVVLLDVGLPSMDGYEVARRLRQDFRSQGAGFRSIDPMVSSDEPHLKSEVSDLKSTTLIALTGYGQEEDRRRRRDAGFDHHLTKPVDLDLLRSLIEQTRAETRGS